MNFINFESNSYCAAGRHRSSTVETYGDMTSKCSKILGGYCSLCNRKKSMTLSDNTIKTKGLSSFFKNLGKMPARAGKKLATNVL